MSINLAYLVYHNFLAYKLKQLRGMGYRLHPAAGVAYFRKVDTQVFQSTPRGSGD